MREINNISKIGIISDTHIINASESLPKKVHSNFKNTDLIIHCGDIVSPHVITELEAYAPVIVVKGNMDTQMLELPTDEIILINGTHTICVSHGSGSPFGLTHKLYKQFVQYNPSIILFGHTHIAGDFEYNGVRLFNPGSPTTRADYYSIGLIHIKGKTLTTNVIVI
ncbi:MAG: metallophosphoesterase family protein [bacterium]